jgi:outer membrane biogenesis lipoprotein LolB
MAAAVIMALLAGCSGQKKKDAEAIDIDRNQPTTQNITPPPSFEGRGKNVMAPTRESWVAKEMRKEGYDPKNMTGKDYRRLFKVEE